MCILVLVEEIKDIPCLVQWGQRFARARDCSLIIAHVAQIRNGKVSEQVPLLPDANEGSMGIQAIRRHLDDDRSDQLDHSTDSRSSIHQSQIPKLWDIAHAKPQHVIEELIEQMQCNLCMMVKKNSTRQSEIEDLSSKLLQSIVCDFMLFRPAADAQENISNHIVIPASGGPHTSVALQLANTVAQNEGMILSPLYVQNPAAGDAEAVARFHLGEILKKSGIQDGPHIENRTMVSANIKESINQAAHDDCKLLIIGASDNHAVTRLLFGTIDANIMSGNLQVSVAIIRKSRPVHSRLRKAFDRFTSSRIPQLDRTQRVELADRLHNGSICNFDYLALI
ncbi:MAG: universal stress protein, partial [Planctomycetes bacterium]|nr:universal stress protein [Planctomycetota bacterium]